MGDVEQNDHTRRQLLLLRLVKEAEDDCKPTEDEEVSEDEDEDEAVRAAAAEAFAEADAVKCHTSASGASAPIGSRCAHSTPSDSQDHDLQDENNGGARLEAEAFRWRLAQQQKLQQELQKQIRQAWHLGAEWWTTAEDNGKNVESIADLRAEFPWPAWHRRQESAWGRQHDKTDWRAGPQQQMQHQCRPQGSWEVPFEHQQKVLVARPYTSDGWRRERRTREQEPSYLQTWQQLQFPQTQPQLQQQQPEPQQQQPQQSKPQQSQPKQPGRLPIGTKGHCELGEGPQPFDHEVGAELEDQSDHELLLLLRAEGAPSGEGVLQVAHSALHRLTPEMTVAALHFAARHMPTSTGTNGEKLTESPHFIALLLHLRTMLPWLTQGRTLSRIVWTLGKFDVKTEDVEVAIVHICAVAHSQLSKCTPQELTNMLWGLARLFPGAAASQDSVNGGVTQLASSIVTVCAQRIEVLTAQCLSNSLWAVARLRLRNQALESFLNLCLHELGQKRELHVFSSQGLSNALWALAELRGVGVGVGSEEAALGVCAAVATAAHGRLKEFHSQELSMMAWAIAKLHGRGPLGAGSRRRAKAQQAKSAGPTKFGRASHVDMLLVALADEARSRLPGELSPQSVSNIAWALATLDLVSGNVPEHAPARDFLRVAAAAAATQLSAYSPQAVANLLWAVVRLEPSRKSRGTQIHTEIQNFAMACAKETTLRMLEFQWRDLAGVSVALAHCQNKAAEVITFATLLCGHVAACCHELTSQAMLNIAQACARLRVTPQAMQAMVDAIAIIIGKRQMQLNEVDLRQWQEVQLWCPPSCYLHGPRGIAEASARGDGQ
eukprot:CAMPEP_0117460292 /NCGR_PEP_ID=MMETSP0784-20121206/1927_1 /TAXON_ID=39447 /ORGANISM="" /LENGTH=832 /DNA_ID=CAMNT_0005253949 /DNA_START=8 /DNA_END=2507 /DNA_ORIENTATION=-